MTEPQTPVAPASPDARPARRVHKSGLTQLFLIPMAVCLAVLGIFLLFARISTSDRPIETLIGKIQNEKGNARWEAANELSRRAGRNPELLKDPRVVDALVKGWQTAKTDDPALRPILIKLMGRTVEVRDYFTMSLGATGDPRVVKVLIEALDGPDDKDGGQAKIYALAALGRTGSPDAAPSLLKFSSDPDSGLRTAAAYGLGLLGAAGGEPARERLHALLADDTLDVRWNTALALARLGDAAGAEILWQMTDREALDKLTVHQQAVDPRTGARGEWRDYPLKAENRNAAILNGLKGLAILRDSRLEARLKAVIAGDSDYGVREGAQRISEHLAELQAPRAPVSVPVPAPASVAVAVSSPLPGK